MRGGDTLTDALAYALDHIDGFAAPVAVVNASGLEDKTFVKQSNHACNNFLNTLNGVFNTILVRATRQTDETLGFVATALDHLDASGILLVAQENAHGADSLDKTLRAAFDDVQTVIKYKCRIMVIRPKGLTAVAAGWKQKAALQRIPDLGFWSAPGLFSWNRADIGSKLLLAHLPDKLVGRGADLGCGYGYLSMALADKTGVTGLYCIDADARAVDACRKNMADKNPPFPVEVFWRDATVLQNDIPKLDWVVMNPPFHTQQAEDRELGQKFLTAALKMLRTGGELYLVANRHMPYEAVLEKAAARATVLADKDGFKIMQAKAR